MSSLAKLVKSISVRIDTTYNSFVEDLKRQGVYNYYSNCSPFVKRMMFFDFNGDVTEYRRQLRDYFLSYEYKNNAYYSDEFAERLEECDSHFRGFVDSLKKTRENFVKENPVLLDENVSKYIRNILIENYMKNSSAYKELEYRFKHIYKDIVAQCVNHAMGLATSSWFTQFLK